MKTLAAGVFATARCEHVSPIGTPCDFWLDLGTPTYVLEQAQEHARQTGHAVTVDETTTTTYTPESDL